MQTITEHVKLVRNLKVQINENALKIYEILLLIKRIEAWKSENYYKNQTAYSYKEHSKMDFNLFIEAVFGKSGMWVKSIERILSLDNGKELLLKHGRSNMVTYYDSTDEERAAILAVVKKKRKLARFNAVKRELYPAIKKTDPVTNIWEQKYKEMKKKYEAIEKKYKALKQEFDNYKNKVESLMNGIRKVA